MGRVRASPEISARTQQEGTPGSLPEPMRLLLSILCSAFREWVEETDLAALVQEASKKDRKRRGKGNKTRKKSNGAQEMEEEEAGSEKVGKVHGLHALCLCKLPRLGCRRRTRGKIKRRTAATTRACWIGSSASTAGSSGTGGCQRASRRRRSWVPTSSRGSTRQEGAGCQCICLGQLADFVPGAGSTRLLQAKDRFQFGRPDIELLRVLCRDRFGWDRARADEILVPCLKAYEDRESQLRMDQFLTFSQRFAKVRSKRLAEVLQGHHKAQGQEAPRELLLTEEERKQLKRPRGGKKGAGRGTGDGGHTTKTKRSRVSDEVVEILDGE